MPQLNNAQYQAETSFIKVKNGMTFCVEERGNKGGEPILLIMGLACQLTQWPETLLNGLVDKGYRVICFDNRDVGLSDKTTSSIKVDTRMSFLKHKLGMMPDANYTLYNMANDTSHILRALNIQSAHILGVSMGGMVAQIMGAFYPEQVRTLTIMMSSTNSPWLPMPELGLVYKLSKRSQNKHDINSVTERWYRFWTAVASPEFKADPSVICSKLRENYLRNYSPGGTIRQLQAILGTACLKKHLKSIACPTLVIHGEKDPLLKPACGKEIAKHIPDSKITIIKGMGHDLPEKLMPDMVSLISKHAQKE